MMNLHKLVFSDLIAGKNRNYCENWRLCYFHGLIVDLKSGIFIKYEKVSLKINSILKQNIRVNIEFIIEIFDLNENCTIIG